jgi:hypothetical protein
MQKHLGIGPTEIQQLEDEVVAVFAKARHRLNVLFPPTPAARAGSEEVHKQVPKMYHRIERSP